MPDLELQSELWRGIWCCLECGGENTSNVGQHCFVPDTTDWPFWTPFLAGKRANPAFKRTWKGSQNGQTYRFWPFNAFYRFLFPGLWYRIQLWCHWHHYNNFTISKTPTFCLRKSRFCGHPRFVSKSAAMFGLYGHKKRVCQISNYRANCAVGFDVVWNVGVKIRRT